MVRLNCSNIFVVFTSVALLSGCSAGVSRPQAVATGAVAGTAIGAGSGAAIGATIAHGDVAASALAGGGIGLGVGIASGLIYHAVSQSGEIDRNSNAIIDNQDDITATQRVLDRYRENLDNETREIQVDESLREYRYEGPSLGNYYR